MVPNSPSNSPESALRAMLTAKVLQQTSAIRQGLDSGYASAVTSQNNSPELDCSIASNIRSRSFVEQLQRPRKVEQLKIFTIPIPQTFHDRFNDLNELFSERLVRYLSKGKVELTSISIRLRTLGTSEDTAVPWILIQCDKSASKRVRKFFSQPDVKREYQPDATSGSPRLPIHILERSPRPLATSAYSDCINRQSPTLCGSLISLGDSGERRLVTIGGLIKFQISEDEFVLYGMTAGHSIVSNRSQMNDLDAQSDDGKDSIEEDYESDLEEFEEFEEDNDVVYELDLELPTDLEPEISFEPQKVDTFKIGSLSHVSENSHHDKTNTDWGLVKLDLLSFYLPNILTQPGSNSKATQREIILPSTSCSKFDLYNRTVRVIGGISGNQLGTLSLFKSLILAAPSKMFRRTHSLVLLNGQTLKPGDSGSWVVDCDSGILYGHVVASDASGEVHVMPIDDTIQHMEEQLMPESISLPTREDIALWLVQCSLISPDLPLIFPIEDTNQEQNLCHDDKSLLHDFEVRFQIEQFNTASRAPHRPSGLYKRLSRLDQLDQSDIDDRDLYPPSFYFWDESAGFHSDSGYSSLQPSPDMLSLEAGCNGSEEEDDYSDWDD